MLTICLTDSDLLAESDLLEFFAAYAEEFSNEWVPDDGKGEELSRRLPNLLIIGYLIRLLEERVD